MRDAGVPGVSRRVLALPLRGLGVEARDVPVRVDLATRAITPNNWQHI